MKSSLHNLKKNGLLIGMMGFALVVNNLFAAKLFAAPKLILQDAFVFRVINEVVSLNDMQRDYKLLQDLKCYYPESVLVIIFENLRKNADSINFNSLTPKQLTYDKSQKEFFAQVIKFYKLKAYISSHQVVVAPALVGGLYTVAKRSGCRLNGFESSDKLQENFEQLLKMEIFLRSRFLPDEKGPPSKERLVKIKSSARLFLESVSKQITEEVFW